VHNLYGRLTQVTEGIDEYDTHFDVTIEMISQEMAALTGWYGARGCYF
jgi:hypothetical protein